MNPTRQTSITWLSAIGYRLMLGVLVSVFALQAQANCNFFDAFNDNNDGTITDPRDGLVWKRCAEGLDWSGTSCSGSPITMSWFMAMQHAKSNQSMGKNDWRLPTKTEFDSVTSESDCFGSSIASSVDKLPAASALFNLSDLKSSFWNANSEYMRNFSGESITVDARLKEFLKSIIRTISRSKYSTYNVRLVRGGQAGELAKFVQEYDKFVLPHQRSLEIKAKEEAEKQKQIQADAAKEALCMRTASCKAKRVAQEAQERRDQAARDEQFRRDAPAREARQRHIQMCEAQKQTCFASCPSYDDSARVGTGANSHHFQCNSRCNQISCY